MKDENLLEKEVNVIISSICKCVRLNDIRYLIPTAYKWLCKQQGFLSCHNWDGFTEWYEKDGNFEKDLFENYNRFQNGSNFIYGSIIRALSE